jgi:hypothetical protein
VPLVQDCPDGYPRLGAFLDSDDNFMVYRRFGYLQSRLLLEKQEHLRQLEEELDNLDTVDAQKESRNLITMENYDSERYKPRRDLMQRIEYQFQGYGTQFDTLKIMSDQAINRVNSVPSPSCSVAHALQSAVFRRPQERGELHQQQTTARTVGTQLHLL